jgi:hypothetical protein
MEVLPMRFSPRLTIVFLAAAATFLAVALAGTASSHAQNPNYPGYLGVYVVSDGEGMRIDSFIPRTPAQRLAADGGIGRYDTILRLGGRATRSLSELKNARDRIPMNMEAKMVLRDRSGDVYHVWISRNVAAQPARGGVYGAAPKALPDTFRKGGRGEGGDENFRERTTPNLGDADGGNDDEGNFRERRP